MTFSTLKSTVAILALTAGTAFADTSTSADAKMEKAEVNAEAAAESAGNAMERTGESAEAATEGTADYVEKKAKSAGDAIDEAADSTADAVSDAARSAENATEEAYEETADALDNAGDTTGNMADDATNKTVDATDDAVDPAEDTADAADIEMSDESRELDTAEKSMDTDTDMETGVDSSLAGLTVGDMIGKNVVEANGEDIGEIDYIVSNGTSKSAVIGIGGFLGLGEYTVAVPMSEFEASQGDANALKLSRWTEEELKNQPEFDETNVESLPDDTRIEEVSY